MLQIVFLLLNFATGETGQAKVFLEQTTATFC